MIVKFNNGNCERPLVSLHSVRLYHDADQTQRNNECFASKQKSNGIDQDANSCNRDRYGKVRSRLRQAKTPTAVTLHIVEERT